MMDKMGREVGKGSMVDSGCGSSKENSQADVMLTYMLVSLTLFAAGILHGFSGFGPVLVALPILSMFLDIKTVVPVLALTASSMTLVLFIQLRPHMDWSKVFPLILGAIPGVFAGTLLLKRADQRLLRLLLGSIIIVYVIYVFVSAPRKKNIREGWAFFFGFCSGCLGGALSAVGPPIVVYVSLKNWDKNEIKATMQGFFLISGAWVVLVFALNHLVTPSVLRLYGASLPFALVGTVLGSHLYGYLSDESYRKMVLGILAVLGMLTIYRAYA